MKKTKAFKELKKKYGNNGKKGGCCSSSSSSSGSSCSSSSSSSCCRRGPPGPQGPPGPTPNFFGNCSDGDFSDQANAAGSTITLFRDVYFHNLSVYNIINTNGYRLFVCGTLTLNGGNIQHNGGNGSADSAGPGATTGTLGGGFAGGYGYEFAQAEINPILGGLGGAGASPGGFSLPPPNPQGGTVIFNNFVDATDGRTIDGILIYGGTGGGSASTIINSGFYSTFVTAPGGGGGGGGVLGIYANNIVGTGTFTAYGGNGYQGGYTGGGGGGVIIQVFGNATAADVTYNVSGGLGGQGGQNGQPGSVYIVPIYPVV